MAQARRVGEPTARLGNDRAVCLSDKGGLIRGIQCPTMNPIRSCRAARRRRRLKADPTAWAGCASYDLLESPQSTATDRAAHSAIMVAG